VQRQKGALNGEENMVLTLPEIEIVRTKQAKKKCGKNEQKEKQQ
jgi:hypothetical protein